jgi:site-specific recombinase XerD
MVSCEGRALQVLCGWRLTDRRPDAWVFPSRKYDRHTPTLIGVALEHAARRAGLDNFHFHDLRHTAASYLAMSGASLLDIAEILGHKQLAQTRKYTHLLQGHKAQVVGRMLQQFDLDQRPQEEGEEVE